MKICYLIDGPWDKWGGGQEHVTRVTGYLNTHPGISVDIIHPQKIFPKFNFLNFFHRLWFTLWTLRFLLSSNYDLYHSHTFSTSLFLPLVKLRGKKMAMTLHGEGKNLIGGGIINLLGIPRVLQWLVLDIWPFDLKFSAGHKSGFIFVGNGVEIKEFDRMKKIKHRGFRLYWLGRKFDPIKGLKYLEEAVKGLGIELDIQDKVFGQEKIRHFKSADLYVLPSLSEGFPIVLLEAMAAKLPIAATDVGDCKRLVEAAKCGIVVPPGDPKALARAILEIKNLKNNFGENGYEFVKKNYTWDKVAAIYDSSYRRFNT